MGRAIKNPPAAAAVTKLVATGEMVLGEYTTPDVANQTAYTYNYPKQGAASETYLYMAAQWCGLEAYSYAPSPVIRCANQTAYGNNGSQYFFGYTSAGNGSEAEYNLYSCQNFAHSETLDGFGANISGANFGIGTVPIIIRWETANSSANRPGFIFNPSRNAGSYDARGQTNWWGYLRVWEIAY